MKLSILLLIVVVGVFSLGCSSFRARPIGYVDSEELLRGIEKDGPRVTISSLFSDEQRWSFVKGQIANGSDDWIKVAFALRSGSDGGVSSELHDAIFEALKINAVSVLSRVNSDLSIETLCSGRSDPLGGIVDAMVELDAVEKSVAGVTDISLITERRLCLKKIDEAKEKLRNFFGDGGH